MEELVELLNRAGRAYYQESREIMSNYEYDALYDELTQLEKELQVTLAGSPTIHVGTRWSASCQRRGTKVLCSPWTRQRMWRSCGPLPETRTWSCPGRWTASPCPHLPGRGAHQSRNPGKRGGGGSDHRKCPGVQECSPSNSYQGELILRGEAVIGYKDFERINEEIPDADARYKIPGTCAAALCAS